MNRSDMQCASHPDCPIRNVLARISDKWSLLLTGSNRMRFGELLKAIPDISQKMLTVTLRTLEQDGFVARTAYAEIPPRVETLTDRARLLLPQVDTQIGRAHENMADIIADRKRYRA
ncbi:MAG: helix-turn-helix transcriptional regulator [Alistipes sp.]|nr:helix-turn-helix transcriptional regulator [Alistipes sp.]MDE7130113.1 helix-turn-helix transcriptional regulator [Alistipes sp.]